MFDPSTEELIRHAPTLDGLDNNQLSKEFTRIYTTIVAARMRLRDLASQVEQTSMSSKEVLEVVAKEMKFLRELASTQEALISVSPSRDDRRSAAFVAGTAHYVLLQAERIVGDKLPSRLEMDYVSPEVSATVLFMIAGASADAAEMAREIEEDFSQQRPHRALLMGAIRKFARGELLEIQPHSEFTNAESSDHPRIEQAIDALYHLIYNGLASLAAEMLGDADSGSERQFAQVEALCSRTVESQVIDLPIVRVFAGPRHLAVLLRILAGDFPGASVANLRPPNGSDPTRWRRGIHHISRGRPYLWPNHLEAIQSGYLELGTSAAISFPTGAGKSTLSELKILATLSKQLDVVFLAPTLSLVDQTARVLDAAFPDAAVEREHASDDPFGFDATRLPPITVMTPERCLALMGFEAELFENVGLIVFDECHLLHAIDTERGKRAVDSMLCVLNAVDLAPKADMLMLSAMMSNATQIAGWLQSVMNRPCLALSMSWKPTRQVRGCLVYPRSEVDALKILARSLKASATTDAPPEAAKRQMRARPQGFFGLKQTWDTTNRVDYALLPLLNRSVQLALSRYWKLTPNANNVAAAVGAAAVDGSSSRVLKTLIFCQTTVNANSTAEYTRRRLGQNAIQLSAEEDQLFELALQEIGSIDCLYVEVSLKKEVTSSALPHHARLLPAERHLHESLYRREDGVHVLAATSTLSQGMNLPSQIVLIAGDSRFDAASNQLERLQAHELLNAAGRAGRAGESSYGFVLVIPSKVVYFDDSVGLIHEHWTSLKEIFSQSDQCLAIEDPLAPILDSIHLHEENHAVAEYLLRRLPVGDSDEETEKKSRVMLSRTFNAYLKGLSGDQDWLESRVVAAISAKMKLADSDEDSDWSNVLAAKFGIQASTLRSLEEHLQSPPSDTSINGWIGWLFDWLRSEPRAFIEMTRQEGLETLFGGKFTALTTPEERGEYAIARLLPLVEAWIAGQPFTAIEKVFSPSKKKLNKCESSRDFVLRVLPDIAYIASLPELIRRSSGTINESWLTLERLSGCVRDGLDSLEKLALYQIISRPGARIASHEAWNVCEFWTETANLGEDWKTLRNRVRKGWAMCNTL
ncbi:DEAD/DEAH box helicase [Alcaligenes sp. A-TC2]|uniref:DEAD/DEAH box helicase n=1 Tax=Alcaligenes nematophilus TaxID=2994643 RepID=UPI00224F804E|nr:DEAD/DEAH box helicase [Alcaligenes nematophilus]MCX5470199.1 DEAD/DEAH box helicase [Alcaligenes nematophilus]